MSSLQQGIDFYNKGELEQAKFHLEAGIKEDAAKAHYYLGKLYFKRDNNELANQHFEEAAERNYALAFHELGMQKLRAKDYTKTKALFSQAFKLGDETAYCKLGYLYLNGYGVEQSFQQAKYYYEKCPNVQVDSFHLSFTHTELLRLIGRIFHV